MADPRDEVRAAFEGAHRDFRQALEAMTPEQMLQESSDPGWTNKDIVAHLASIDQRLRGQIQAALDGTAWNPPEDVDTFNARMVAERKGWTLEQVRAELDKSRDETLVLFNSVKENELDRYIDHPRRGRVSILDLVGNAGRHIQTHASEMRKA